MTMMAPTQIRHEIDAYLASFGGQKAWQCRYSLPIPNHRRLRIEVWCDVRDKHVFIMIDRWNAHALPNEGPECDWITGHIYPFTQVWLSAQRSKAASTPRPDAGMVSTTKVRPCDALEVLSLWIPKELRWQEQISTSVLTEPIPTPKETDQ